MTRWFRFYDDAVNDPKVQRLPGEKFKAWVNLLCLASKNGGVLPSLADISFLLRMGEEKVSGLLNEFCQCGLIDPVEVSDAPMSYEPHNWSGRQFKSDVSNERVKRHRERKCNVTETVTVTPPDTDTDTEQSRKKETREDALLFADYLDQFWELWPNKVGKPPARKAFRSALKRAPFDAIIAGVHAYIRDKPPDRPWLNPATFLNQNRWEDQPAKVQNGSHQVRSSGSLIDALKRDLAKIEREDGTDYSLPDSSFLRISG